MGKIVAFWGRERNQLPSFIAWILSFVGATTWAVIYIQNKVICEDAFITFRYAQNLAQGSGMVFNYGEKILATTSPLVTLLLALLNTLGLSIPLASTILSSISVFAICIIGFHILERYTHLWLGFVWIVFLLGNVGGLFVSFPLETPLYLAFLFIAFYMALKNQPIFTGIFLGLVILTRHDAVLFAFALFFLLFWKRREFPFVEVIMTLAVIVPWFLFAQSYFGSFFPHTLQAKAGAVTHLEYVWKSIIGQLYALNAPVFFFIPREIVRTAWLIPGTLILFGSIIFYFRKLIFGEVLLAQGLFYVILIFIGYTIIAPPPEHVWHLTPPLYFVMFTGLLCWGKAITIRSTSRLNMIVMTMTVVITGILLVYCGKFYAKERVPQGSERVLAYDEIARWYRDSGINAGSVLMLEPGYFGFMTGARMVDAVGLLTPGIRYHHRTHRTPPSEIVKRFQPDLIIVPELWTFDNKNYIKLFNHPLGVLVYKRSDADI